MEGAIVRFEYQGVFICLLVSLGTFLIFRTRVPLNVIVNHGFNSRPYLFGNLRNTIVKTKKT